MSSPDILDCLANLSSDEVFTPPKLANDMLDLLPSSLWRNPNARFCDPFTKSGVFLREIVKRLDAGLADAIPDKDERIRHILGRQVYGVAITRLTALLARRTLYCNKDAHGSHAAIQRLFRDECGLVAYSRSSHRWRNGACEICGASEKEWGAKRSADVENYAYPFLHDERIIKMAEELGFDVVIGNPPYQMSDGSGGGVGAVPIYQLFVEQAKKLGPRYLVMVIPARWYSGGRGLDSFRDNMLNDDSLRDLVDYVDSEECFPGVDVAGGICYFLRDSKYHGQCSVTTIQGGNRIKALRRLNEFPTFIRHPIALSIVKKVIAFGEPSASSIVSSQKPFGLRTYVTPDRDGDLILRYNKGTGPFKRKNVSDKTEWVDKWKVIMSYLTADHAGRADSEGKRKIFSSLEVLPPKTICTETYIVVGVFKTKNEAHNLLAYLKTLFTRFLVAQIATTQHISKASFSFVPIQDFSKPWTDAELYKKYGLDEKEIAFIESMIRPMEDAR